MAEQDGWKPYKTQPEPLLPISSRPGAHYRRLQEFVGSSRPVGLRREAEAAVAPFQWPSGANRFRSLEKCFFKTSSGNDQCHLCYPWYDRFLSLQSDVCGSAIHRRQQFRAKRARIEAPLVLGFLADNKIETINPMTMLWWSHS